MQIDNSKIPVGEGESRPQSEREGSDFQEAGKREEQAVVEETYIETPAGDFVDEQVVSDGDSNSIVSPVPPTGAQTYTQSQTPPPYCAAPAPDPSAFSRSWQDIKSTPEAVKSFGFKGLVECVPILNFVNGGLAGKWNQQLIDGVNAPLPKKTVDSDNFVKGFYYFLVALVLGLVLGVLNIVPVIGQIVFFVGTFFITTFAAVMFQRAVAFGSLGEAFDLKDIWDKIKRNFGELWVATFVPELIVSAISGAVAFVIMMMFGLSSLIGIMSGFESGYVGGAIAGLSSLGIGGILCFIVVMFANAIGLFWSLRGCAWWVRKHVPEWTSANAGASMSHKRAEEQARAAAQQRQYQAQQQAAQQQREAQQQQYQAQQMTSQSYQQPQQSQQPVAPQSEYPEAQQLKPGQQPTQH